MRLMEWRETSEEAKREIQVFRRHQGLREILHWHWRQALRGAGLAVKETGVFFYLVLISHSLHRTDGMAGVFQTRWSSLRIVRFFHTRRYLAPNCFVGGWRGGTEASHFGFGSSMEITARTGKDSRYIGRGWDTEKNISAGRNYDGFFFFFFLPVFSAVTRGWFSVVSYFPGPLPFFVVSMLPVSLDRIAIVPLFPGCARGVPSCMAC